MLSDYILSSEENISNYNSSARIYFDSHSLICDGDKARFECDAQTIYLNFGESDEKDAIVINGNRSWDYEGIFWVNTHEAINYKYMFNLLVSFIKRTNSKLINQTGNKSLIATRGVDDGRSCPLFLDISDIYCDDSKYILSYNYLDIHNTVGFFTNKITRPITDTDGNNKDVSDLIGGIIKDSDGKPRNILSNVIF